LSDLFADLGGWPFSVSVGLHRVGEPGAIVPGAPDQEVSHHRATRYHHAVRRASVADRKATRKEVTAHREAIRELARDVGLADVRLRSDGTVVVHSNERGDRGVIRLSAAASERVGYYVHVITDDVPGAGHTQEL